MQKRYPLRASISKLQFGADAWLQKWLGQWGRAVLSNVGTPEVALDRITVRDGQLNMWVAGESVPRQFEQVDYTVALGRDYQDLDLALSGKLCHLMLTVVHCSHVCLFLTLLPQNLMTGHPCRHDLLVVYQSGTYIYHRTPHCEPFLNRSASFEAWQVCLQCSVGT